MSLAEFKDSVDRRQRSMWVALLIAYSPMLVALAWIGVYATVQKRFESFLAGRFSPAMADLLAIAPMAVPSLAAFALLIAILLPAERRCRIPCPHCGQDIMHFKGIVIASRNCPHCDRRVIDPTPLDEGCQDLPSESLRSPRMNLEDFRRAAETYHRKARLPFLPTMIAFVICITWVPFHARLVDSLIEKFSPVVAATIAVLPVAVPLALGMGLAIPLIRRIERRYGTPCPHCGKPLGYFRGIVIATRNCPNCSERVIED